MVLKIHVHPQQNVSATKKIRDRNTRTDDEGENFSDPEEPPKKKFPPKQWQTDNVFTYDYLLVFYGIWTFVGYLIPNPFLYK